jgi:hypothetical protein
MRSPRNRALVLLLLEAVVLFYILRPMLWSSYSGDDTWLSQGPMKRALTGDSVWDSIGDWIRNWANWHGRFFPMAFAQAELLFELVQTRAAYKVVQVVGAMVAWGSVLFFVRALTRSWDYTVITGAALLFFFQFRFFHDPILQFFLHQPVLVILTFLSLGLVVLAMRATSTRAHRWLLVAASLLWIWAMLTYETTYVLVVVPLGFIAWLGTAGRRWLGIAAFILPVIVLSVVVVVLRSRIQTSGPSYTMNLDPAEVAPTFVYQLTGIVPFAYHVLSRQQGLPGLFSGWSIAGEWDLLALACSAGIAYLLLRWVRPPILERRISWLLLWVGAWFVLIPTATIAVTRRWQMGEVAWGLPYVSVFFSGIGLALVLLFGFDRLRAARARASISGRARRTRKALVPAIAGVFGLLLVLGPQLIQDTNRWVVDMYSPRRVEREAFVGQVRQGVFDTVPPGSVVIADRAGERRVFNGAFVAWYGGPEHLRFVTPTDPVASLCGEEETCFRYAPDGMGGGEVRPYPGS